MPCRENLRPSCSKLRAVTAHGWICRLRTTYCGERTSWPSGVPSRDEGARWSLKLTPKCMRRTFNDLARQARVHDIVLRSISGHLTETMQERYSTAASTAARTKAAVAFDRLASGHATATWLGEMSETGT
jgi:integrase